MFGTYAVAAVDGVAYGLLLFVLAAGLTLSFGIGNILNLAHGTVYVLGAYIAAKLGDGGWGALLLALVVGTAAGGVCGGALAGLSAPLAKRGHLAQALLTFGLALIGGDMLTTAFGSQELPVTVPNSLGKTVVVFGHRYPDYRLAFIGLAAVLAVIGYVVLARSRAGAMVRATANDSEMVAAMGVDPRFVRTAVLVVSGALAGLAGVLGAPVIGPAPGTADNVLLLSLTVVVLGGVGVSRGALGGTLLAAILVGQTQTLGVSLAPNLTPYLLFAAMAAVLVVRGTRLGSLA